MAAVLIVLGWLAGKCLRDPSINFLPGDRRAEWILFPAAIDPRTHTPASIDATFTRTFTVESQATGARLEFRAAKRVEFKINGEKISPSSPQNWKQISLLDVSRFIKPGENKIEARVYNDDSPPALWLVLVADKATLRTDDKWEASIAGSSGRPSSLASIPRNPQPGNLLAGGETISDVLPKIWPIWIAVAIIAIGVTLALQRWIKQDVDLSRIQVSVAISVCAIAWLILFWNNWNLLPFRSGYDSKDHLAYIQYIQERGALPMPNEGYEMFQPPLFYVLSAGLLWVFHLTTGNAAAIAVLRAFTMLFGIGNFIFAFLTVRLLFRARPLAQLIGLILAAFLPMQLYLSHYVTNETLAAMLASASIYFAVRVLSNERVSTWELIILGVCVGAAMLAKATSLLLIPPLFAALAIRCWQQRAGAFYWIRTFGLTVAAILLVCGWHYARIWRHYGKPIVGNWESTSGFNWWQDPGFHVGADYFRFGRALVRPLFSGFNGFADGIYSTLWGDALCGGLSGILSRTPWNYSLMIAGYWIALIPTILILLGCLCALRGFLRQRLAAPWFFLITLSVAVALSLIFMTLRVPSYAQVKAFYGLSAIAPLCCFAILGWDFLRSRLPILRPVLMVAIISFGANSFVSFWIRPSTDQCLYTAIRLTEDHKLDQALVAMSALEQRETANPTGRWLKSSILEEIGQSDKAVEEAREGIRLDPQNGGLHLLLGVTLGKQGQTLEALAEAKLALELQPENPKAYDLIFTLLHELHRSEEAFAVGRDALAVSPFDPALHYRIGLVAGEIGDFATAAQHLGYANLLAPKRSDVIDKLLLALRFAAQSSNAASQLKEIATLAPDSPPLLNELAWIFATNPNASLRFGGGAVDLARRACLLTERKQPRLVATAAAANAEAGNYPEAIADARAAVALATSQGDTRTAQLADQMLTKFQTNEPYREEPHP